MSELRGAACNAQKGSSIVELLLASTLGMLVVLAAVEILRVHAALALQVQAELTASTTATWALRTALRDIRTAGADPRQGGVTALAEASRDSMTLLSDRNGDGFVDDRSHEAISIRWSERRGGGISRRVGLQSMVLASRVSRDAFRLRYFDREGREVSPDRPLDSALLGQVRLVRVEIGVEESLGRFRGSASRMGAAAIRLRESSE